MKHGSFFTGIGGFDLAARWMGWENVFQVEIDKWCRKVLEKNFPNVKRHEDIKEFNGKKYLGAVDIISGGFPCQPFSHAGKRKGTDDDRYLWPEMFRGICESRPSFVVGENVAGLVTMEDGRVLDRILLDLESEGYTTEQFIIPACGVGAWHRRARLWIVAYRVKSDSSYLNTNGTGFHRTKFNVQGKTEFQDGQDSIVESLGEVFSNSIDSTDRAIRGKGGEAKDIQELHRQAGLPGKFSGTSGKILSNCNDQGLQIWSESKRADKERWENKNGSVEQSTSNDGRTLSAERRCVGTTESRLGGVVNGIPDWMDEPAGIPRVATGIKDRINRLKGLGNAIVPQVAFELFKVIEQLNNELKIVK